MALCVASEKLIFIVISIIAVIFLFERQRCALAKVETDLTAVVVDVGESRNKTRTNAKKGKERARKIQLVRASE